jgi:hypothetical protein
VQKEHAQYFEALQKHPRLLVGTEVPRINGEGMEKLRDSGDAKEWQEAVKHILVEEVRDRASKAMEENSDFLTTIHGSIELFQNNADLVPGTKEFDVDLANRFSTLMEPYELRNDGKLQGYSIPVQPIVNQLRAQVAAERTKATTRESQGSPASGAGASTPSAPAAAADPPQAGVTSKAGSGASSDASDFSTLFGTIGLPDLQI